MSLSLEMFGDYFRAVHCHDPFPWQARLLRQVLADGWPKTIALPTAAGKTAVMDVAVFALACQADLPMGKRIATRRIALIVDRRIVVDDAYARARKITALLNPTAGVLSHVASALKSLGGETPLDCALMRGGIYREDRWARTPAQPVILCSTVDQVGSRLLHRGYGLSESLWPIHAGLLGNDTLLVLDEAHCSRPFLQTLEWIRRYRTVAKCPIATPFAVIAMTATPHTSEPPFLLDDEDRKDETLKKRLAASKRMRLIRVEKKGDDAFVTACVDQLCGTKESPGLAQPGTTTLVVLNRVGAARALREKLRHISGLVGNQGARWENEAILLTGRCRPVERDVLLDACRDRVMAGRKRETLSRPPFIVVATQCVEVGADIDADALLTEACPLDSLRQRLGRLDRLGLLGETQAVCLVRPEYADEEAAFDPVYGGAAAVTWKWLTQQAKDGSLNCGTDALANIMPKDEELAALCAPVTDAPVIFPAYCDLWCQTGPQPGVSPAPGIFLHGQQSGEPDVRFVWRADLDPEQPETWADTVALCPPVAGEALPLPIGQARAWLAANEDSENQSDIESPLKIINDKNTEASGCRTVLRWRGPERSEVISDPRAIRPGDVLVLPSSMGGCDAEGWNQAARETRDLADVARFKARRNAVLRLHPSLQDSWGDAKSISEPLALLDSSGMLPENVAEMVSQFVSALSARTDLPQELLAMVTALNNDKKRRIDPHPSGKGVVLHTRERLGNELTDFSDEDALSSLARGGAVGLDDHLQDAAKFAERCAIALPESLKKDVILAARMHDIGKADPRFQIWLNGGNRLRALRSGLLAKSRMLKAGANSIARSRQDAGYPVGGRHELLSVRLAESCDVILGLAHDRDLVLHLVAAHHGHCRPFAPVVEDEHPVSVDCDCIGQHFHADSGTGLERLDSGVAGRFWRLIRRYGWWGLAYLEACLRLADHRASEAPTHIQED